MAKFPNVLKKAKPASPGEASRGVRSRGTVKGAVMDAEWESPRIGSEEVRRISWVLLGVTVATLLSMLGTFLSMLDLVGYFEFLVVGSLLGFVSVHAVVLGIERKFRCVLKFQEECVLGVWLGGGFLVLMKVVLAIVG